MKVEIDSVVHSSVSEKKKKKSRAYVTKAKREKLKEISTYECYMQFRSSLYLDARTEIQVCSHLETVMGDLIGNFQDAKTESFGRVLFCRDETIGKSMRGLHFVFRQFRKQDKGYNVKGK